MSILASLGIGFGSKAQTGYFDQSLEDRIVDARVEKSGEIFKALDPTYSISVIENLLQHALDEGEPVYLLADVDVLREKYIEENLGLFEEVLRRDGLFLVALCDKDTLESSSFYKRLGGHENIRIFLDPERQLNPFMFVADACWHDKDRSDVSRKVACFNSRYQTGRLRLTFEWFEQNVQELTPRRGLREQGSTDLGQDKFPVIRAP